MFRYGNSKCLKVYVCECVPGIQVEQGILGALKGKERVCNHPGEI